MITREHVVARADVNDAYGVTVWQRRKLLELTSDEARAFGQEILRAADEADRYEADRYEAELMESQTAAEQQLAASLVQAKPRGMRFGGEEPPL